MFRTASASQIAGEEIGRTLRRSPRGIASAPDRLQTLERCYHPAMRSGYFRSFSPAYVDSVRDSSPATEAGIETGDVLVHVDDRPASGAESRHDQWPGRRMTPGIVPTKALQPCWAVDEFCANAQPYQVSEVPDFDRRPQMR